MSFQTIVADRHNAVIDAAAEYRDAEIQNLKNQENAIDAAKTTEIKYLIEKVYFSYTLTTPTADQLDTWAKAIVDGIDPMAILQSYILPISIYNNASPSLVVDRLFNTVFGRSPTITERAHYSESNSNLIPALVALEAKGMDAQALTWRMQLLPNMKSIVDAASLPSSIAQQMIEQTFVSLPNLGSNDSALSTLNAFVSGWRDQQTLDNRTHTDQTPPTGVSASKVGKLLVMQFSEPINWSSLDRDHNGRISLDTELIVSVSDVTKTVTSSATAPATGATGANSSTQASTVVTTTTSITVPGSLGSGASVLVADQNRLVLQIGQSPEIGSSIAVVGVSDLYGNYSDVIFKF